jgi:hypothetical protein
MSQNESVARMAAIQAQVEALRNQYTAEKEKCKILRESIGRVKNLKDNLHEKKLADRKRVDDLKAELEQLKNKPAMTPEQSLTEDMKDSLRLYVEQMQNEIRLVRLDNQRQAENAAKIGKYEKEEPKK